MARSCCVLDSPMSYVGLVLLVGNMCARGDCGGRGMVKVEDGESKVEESRVFIRLPRGARRREVDGRSFRLSSTLRLVEIGAGGRFWQGPCCMHVCTVSLFRQRQAT